MLWSTKKIDSGSEITDGKATTANLVGRWMLHKEEG